MATIYAIDYSEELVCPLCLDTWKSPKEVQPCGHIFCEECFPKNASTCPICRGPVNSLKTPHRTLVALALEVRVRCQRCGWEGTREESAHHKCDSKSFASKPSAASIPIPASRPPKQSGDKAAGVTAAMLPGAAQARMYDIGEGQSFYELLTMAHDSSNGEFGSAQPWLHYGMTEEEYLQAVSLFDFFTEGQSKVLGRPEVTRLMRWLNYAHTPQEIAAIFADMDTDGDGLLDREEYLTWLSRHQPDPQALYGLSQVEYNQVMMLFHMFDIDQDGWLHKSDVCDLLLNAKKVNTLNEAERCFREMDRDGNGLIDLNEFLQYSAKEAEKERSRRSSAASSPYNSAMKAANGGSRTRPPNPSAQQKKEPCAEEYDYFEL